MGAIPYMPLYISDYLADAAHLSTLEHGAYMLLIMTYWQRGKALPASDDRLANIARLSVADWLTIRPVIEEFFECDGASWTHGRIERELAVFRDKSDKARAAGRASAQRRSNGRSTIQIQIQIGRRKNPLYPPKGNWCRCRTGYLSNHGTTTAPDGARISPRMPRPLPSENSKAGGRKVTTPAMS